MAKRTELTEQQLSAIELLAAGTNQTETASAVGVDRRTIIRWMREDPQFIAGLNSLRLAVQGDNAERLRALATVAIDILERSLQSADEKVALKAAGMILDALGLATVAPIKPSDADLEVVEDQMKLDKMGLMMARIKAKGGLKP